MSDNLELVKAEQQLTGFAHAFSGFDAISLIQSMGLRVEEWEQLKIDMPWLPEKLVKEIDEHFDGAG
jgi:hypothetical protein